jgi:endogenous inhibitor of DNA gyrase (YacG/DUF329 family)
MYLFTARVLRACRCPVCGEKLERGELSVAVSGLGSTLDRGYCSDRCARVHYPCKRGAV